MSATCFDCSRPYGDENGFPDLVIPFWAWVQVSPTGDDAGLLCPSCICKRLHDKKIRCDGAFLSGPIMSVSSSEMSLHRRIENIELAIEGRNNHWGSLLRPAPAPHGEAGKEAPPANHPLTKE